GEEEEEDRTMRMEKEREELVRYGRKLCEAGLTKGTGGNLSILDRKNGQVMPEYKIIIRITPTRLKRNIRQGRYDVFEN
ncbi:MAG: hypothetical protein ACFNVM_04340, partial [Neisseria elongata]